MKCFELINELDKLVKFKDLQVWLKARGVAAKSHFHTLYPDEEKELRRAIIRGDVGGAETASKVRALLADRKKQAEKPKEVEPPKPVVIEEEPEPEPAPAPAPKPVEPAKKPPVAEDRGTLPGQLPLRSDTRSAPAMTRRDSPRPGGYAQRPAGGYAQRPAGGYAQRPAGGYAQRPSSGYGARPGAPRPAAPRPGAPRPAPAAPAAEKQRPKSVLRPMRPQDRKARAKARQKAKQEQENERKILAELAQSGGVAESGLPGIKEWKGKIKITDPILVSTLAEKMAVPVNGVIQMLIGLGVMVTRNQRINADCATTVAEEFGWHTEVADLFGEEKEKMLAKVGVTDKNAVTRAPIVTIMGHVDHGKTMLLDAIRSTNVVEGESGGITQHIGAYKVKTARGEVAFIDTPGHEAFSAMRARGAEVTDIVVLVVAADDGLKPQTMEAINHAKQARVPIVVAINKIDLPTANVDRVRQQLAEQGLNPEQWGGKTIFCEVSAKTKKGVDGLLEAILLQAEMLELKADPNCGAVGTVLESRLDPQQGAMATIMVQKGTLRPGQAFVTGTFSGRVRTMTDELGHKVAKAGPATPVVITGMTGVPGAGDLFMAVANDREARDKAARNQEMKQSADQRQQRGLSLVDLQQKIADGSLKTMNLILKADVDGSIGAIRDLLVKFEHKEVALNWVHAATGNVTESDINLAAASQAIIIAYRVQPTSAIMSLADKNGVEIRTYDIIYQVNDDLKKAVEGLLSPEIREVVLGTAEVKQVFRIGGLGNIAGCMVVEGKIKRSCKARLVRDSVKIWEGGISSLKRFKNDASEVPTGAECGIGLLDFNDVKEGDQILAVEVSRVAVKL